jgi:hypothetical protein
MDGGIQAAEEQITAGATMADALRLDGNAAAGLLREIFAVDLTAARARCAHCGAMQAVGALLVYAHGMGTVMRCPSCEGIIMRVARTRTQMWLDSTGARHIIIAEAALPA